LYTIVRKTRHEPDPNPVLRGDLAGNGEMGMGGAAPEHRGYW
jgi:hypothetical protein